MSTFHFAPSENHQHLLAQTVPTLGYGGEDVPQWQAALRPKLKQLVGWHEMPEQRMPLGVRQLWSRDHELGVVEKIVFTSEINADVPAFVCVPRDVKPPYTWFVCLQGHSTGMHNSIAVDRDDNAKSITVEGDRDFGVGCMRRGIAALCIEQRSFGERRELVQEKTATHGCQDAAMHALMLGRTLLGERVFDVDRALDYLWTRDDVNRQRIGVMGNSGGGTISLFSAALLPRIQVAMPSCYFCTFADSVMSIGHCVDNYVPGLLKVAEMPDIMGLFAPKPVVLVAGKDDPIFPIDATHRAFDHLKRVYAACGAEDRCQLVVGPEGHRFYAEQGWEAMREQLERL